MPKKVVLDTNVFVAAHFNKISASAKIIDLCLQNKLRFCASEGLFKELEFILKNIRAPITYKDKVYCLFEKASLVKPQKLLIIKEDLDDNKFLAVAEKAEADFLITSDHHLLVLKKFKDTQIIKPADFLINIVLSQKNR
jgi:putative PIN family toxin of toxin-antitoxin system